MADYLQFDQLEEGVFYYVLMYNEEPSNRFVWYKRDGRLKSPRCCSDTLKTSEYYHYRPLTLDDVNKSDEWMEKCGDCIGRIAWTAYKMKLRETEMTKKNETKKSEKDVDLYDPKFVHFEWSEDLKGKDGFFVDDIGTLKEELRNKGPSSMGTVLYYSDNEVCPFVVQSRNGGDTGGWRFFYYDPNYEVKWAYFKEGKTVQLRREINGEKWVDVDGIEKKPCFFDSDVFEYRIKPEEEQRTKIEVNVDVKVNNASSDGKIKITINGKECVFENAEQARMILKEN